MLLPSPVTEKSLPFPASAGTAAVPRKLRTICKTSPQKTQITKKQITGKIRFEIRMQAFWVDALLRLCEPGPCWLSFRLAMTAIPCLLAYTFKM